MKRWRLIIRNLPFGVTEDELIKFLSSAGFVWNVSIPRFADGRMKGFGFASFTCRAHATKALEHINSKVESLPVAGTACDHICFLLCPECPECLFARILTADGPSLISVA